MAVHANRGSPHHRFTRQELYDLVWSEPIKRLAAKLGISDAALTKASRRADIPVPEHGYWAKLQAGKSVMRQPLPDRGIGMSDWVGIGDDSSWTYGALADQIATEPIPPPPIFSEAIAVLTERVRKMVGKVSVPRTLERPQPLIARLLAKNNRRRERHLGAPYLSTWKAPIFDSPLEQRRLRVLNGLFLAFQRCGFKPWCRGRDARELAVHVGQQNVSFTLDYIQERLRLTFAGEKKSWEDGEGIRLEDQLDKIAVEMIVAGEVYYREGAQRVYEWRIKRKAELEEKARLKKQEEERPERVARLEKERVERLLNDAANWRRAADLRAYVEAVRQAHASPDPDRVKQLERWAAWVSAEADRIDPIQSRGFSLPDED
jgi:hypothetical protein